MIWKDSWLEILNRPWLGDLERFLDGNCGVEAIG